MSMMEQLSQGLSLQDVLNPASQSAATYTSTGFAVKNFKRIMYEIQIGTISAGGTVDAKLQTAAASSFASPHDVTGSNITQVTASNKRVTIEVRDDQIQAQNAGDQYVRLSVTIGTNTVVFGATGWGGDAVQKPASNGDITAVTQRLVVNT